MQTREEYIQELKAKLDEFNSAIDILQVQGKLAQMETRQEYERQMKKFTAKRDEILSRLEEMRHSSDEAWEEMRRGVDQAWSHLKDAFYQAKSHFK
jgi:chromosome segregation ATPase